MNDRSANTFFAIPTTPKPQADQLALLGVPFDGLSTERRGSGEAPGVLRRWSRNIGSYGVWDGRLRQRAQANAVDLGDADVNRFMGEASFAPIRDGVAGIVENDATPLVVGGEHSLTYGAVHAAAAKHGGLRLVQIDAHHDATDPAEHNCNYNHGTFVRNLIDDGVITGPNVFQIGVRDFQWSDSGGKYLAQRGANIFPLPGATRDEFGAFFHALEREAHRPTWVTLDIDSVDPAFAPGVGEVMVGGFTSRQVVDLTRRLFNGHLNIVGADLVELVPVMDQGERTCALAAQLLAVMFDGLAQEKKANRRAGATPP